jgi:hypothetical protein
MNLVDRTRLALDRAAGVYRGSGFDARIAEVRERLDEPLRVAIAGRVKSGKSTLLNALVADRLAPTDAGECTRIVTWYRDGHTYRVTLHPRRGEPRQLRFTRDEGAIEVDLGDTRPEDVHSLDITWPSQALRRATLIDTPGIGSLSERVSRRAWELLAPDDTETPADAVLYLMRHLHAKDLEFLHAFHDTEVSRPNPVNAIGVLSRADEIGVGRLDALSSARRIARRYRADEKIRGLCQTVVAVAGLLAQTGRTMRQDEFAALTALAELPRSDLDGMLLSVDRFSRTDLPDGAAGPDSDTRARLMERFGLFGVRLSTTLIRQGVTDPNAIASELVKRSGLDELRSVLTTQFSERRDLLKARSALLAVDLVLTREPRPAAAPLVAEVERILAGAHEFAELRLLSTLRSGAVRMPTEALQEAERLLGGDGGSAAARLGLEPDAGPDELWSAALDAVARWQRRAESPMSGRAVSDMARLVVRSCEGILAGLRR